MVVDFELDLGLQRFIEIAGQMRSYFNECHFSNSISLHQDEIKVGSSVQVEDRLEMAYRQVQSDVAEQIVAEHIDSVEKHLIGKPYPYEQMCT